MSSAPTRTPAYNPQGFPPQGYQYQPPVAAIPTKDVAKSVSVCEYVGLAIKTQ